MTDAPNPSAAKTGEEKLAAIFDSTKPLAVAVNRAVNRGPNAEVRMSMSDAMAIIQAVNTRTHPQPSLSVGLDREVRERLEKVAEDWKDAVYGDYYPDEEKREIASDLRSLLALAAPAEGYVLVPVEPTEAMLDAWTKAVGDGIFGINGDAIKPHEVYMRDAYRAMIAACLPAAPTGEGK